MSNEKESKSKNAEVDLNPGELKDFLRHMISNNLYLESKGKMPITTSIVGDSGIGKTSCALQIAEEFNLNLVKLNLGQIDEASELIGFPVAEFEVKKGGESTWVVQSVLDSFVKDGYHITGEKKMTYAPPSWAIANEKGTLLLLDDFSRAHPHILQAVMEICDRMSYLSWKLPKGSSILLTENPSGGDYNVTELDSAQRTRFVTVNLKFDVQQWAAWAERNEIDSRAITFFLLHPNIHTRKANARSITNFFNSISSIKNFDDNLPLIQMIGEGSIGVEATSMFTAFISNKLDKIISPHDIFDKEEDYVLNSIKSVVGKRNTDGYRADISSTIATRIANYLITMGEKGSVSSNVIARLQKLVLSEVFTSDLCYRICRSVFNSERKKFSAMLMSPELVKYISS